MKAIIPNIDEHSKRAYYLQLYDYIKEAILSGEIHSGEKLPSLRNLSKSLGLSMTTVELAYSQLMVEGYIYSRPQSGYYVGNVLPTEAVSVSKKRGSSLWTAPWKPRSRNSITIWTALTSTNGKNAQTRSSPNTPHFYFLKVTLRAKWL